MSPPLDCDAARRGLAVGILLLSLLTSCAAPAPSEGSQLLALDDDGLRVSVPAEWDAMRSSDVGFGGGRVLFYLSNQALRADCLNAGDDTRCELPVDALRDGGVLVLWATSRCAGVACELPAGERLLISGREAARAPRTGACAEIGATEEDVYAVTVHTTTSGLDRDLRPRSASRGAVRPGFDPRHGGVAHTVAQGSGADPALPEVVQPSPYLSARRR